MQGHTQPKKAHVAMKGTRCQEKHTLPEEGTHCQEKAHTGRKQRRVTQGQERAHVARRRQTLPVRQGKGTSSQEKACAAMGRQTLPRKSKAEQGTCGQETPHAAGRSRTLLWDDKHGQEKSNTPGEGTHCQGTQNIQQTSALCILDQRRCKGKTSTASIA